MPKSVFTPRYERFKQLLIEARRAAGLSQDDLALKLARVQTFVSKYERGERRLDVVEFLDVAEALGLDPHKTLKKVSAVPVRRHTPKKKS